MEIVSLLFLFLIPLLTLVFALRFKGIMALIIMAPTVMLLVAVLTLNGDPTVTILYPAPTNATAIQAGPQGYVTTITGNVTTLVTHVIITNSTNSVLLNGAVGGNIFVGEKIEAGSVLIGEDIDTISLKLSKSGNPNGDYEIGVWDGSFTPKLLFCTPVANTLLNSPTFITCRLPVGDAYTIVSGDYIGVSF